jgi:MFS family permease
MLSNFHIPRYFSKEVKKEIGELYASTAIADIAIAMVMLFEPIFLYSVLGFTVQKVLLFMAVVYVVYIIMIPWGGKIASLYGYKHAIAMSVPFQILYWFLLSWSQENWILAFVGAAAWGLSKTLYWPGFHSLMARYSDQQQVGREFGVIYSIVSITHIIGPFIGGWISQSFGFTGTFITAAVIYCSSIIPLFQQKEIFTPKEYHYRETLEMYRAFPRKFYGYLGFGEELLVLTIWPIFIYTVVSNYQEIGIVATLASVIAAVLALLIGKITDQYTKRILVKIGTFFMFLVWLARLVVNNIWNTFAVDALSRTAKELTFIPISKNVYTKAQETHVVPYVVFFEQSLAIGKLLACIIGIIAFTLVGGGTAGFMVLFILGGLFSLLYTKI